MPARPSSLRCLSLMCVRRYVESLEVLSNVFITPLESRRNLPAELAVLFRSVRVLLGLNQTFLNEMKERIDEWSESQCFGDVFLHFAPFMKMYVSYVQQHDDATQVCLCAEPAETVLLTMCVCLCVCASISVCKHVGVATMVSFVISTRLRKTRCAKV